jgi:hypothetical protein
VTKGQTVTNKDPTKPKNKGGRPPRLKLDKDQLKKDLENGLTQQEALKKQGLTHDWAHDKAQKDKELSQTIKASPEEFRNKWVEGSGVKHRTISAFELNLASGHPATVLWAMENVVGFKQAKQVEISGEISHIHTLSPEDRAKRIQQLRAELDAQVVDVAIEAEDKPSDSE